MEVPMSNTSNNYIQKYKMKVFNELVKLAWFGKLEEEIEELPQKIIENIQDEKERKIVENYIRLSMGLDPVKSDRSLREEARQALSLDKVKKPLVSVIENICERCNRFHEGSCPIHSHDCMSTDECIGCGQCIEECSLGAISDKIEFIPVVNLLQEKKYPVFAAIAPAYVGQFDPSITPGKIRTALKMIGFSDMIEVATFADILTMKEAYEYKHIIENNKDFFIASCCCPVWVGMIQKKYPSLLDHMSPAVSPMIAAGRVIKALNENAKVVFIGPCIAKKNEAKEENLADAIDFVLTFRELYEIFNALDIDLENLPEDNREEAAFAGRIYARTGGVSKAVELTVKRLDPRSDLPFKPEAFDGAKKCKDGLDKLLAGEMDATSIEGMGCIGGCVGGPRTINSIEEGSKRVDEYANATPMKTPFDNLNALQFLAQLGIKRYEMLKNNEDEKIRNLLIRNVEK